MLDLSY